MGRRTLGRSGARCGRRLGADQLFQILRNFRSDVRGRKAILSACLAPASIRDAEHKGDLTSRLALMEERKTRPFGAIWDYYCMKQDAGVCARLS